MKKKIFISIISIIVIIGLIVIININNNNKKYIYNVEKLGKENYFLLMKDNKYGVIDRNGNTIIEPNYDVIEIPNPSKDIFICKSNYNVDKNEYSIQVFNKNKEPILYQYYIVEAISLDKVEDNGNYEKSILKYKSDGLYGLIDFSGNKITKPIYEAIDGFEYNEGLLLVKKSGKYGIINMNGAVVVKTNYDEIYSDCYYEENIGYKNSGYIVGKKTNEGMRYGYIDSERKQLLKNEYNEIYRIEDKKDSVYLIASKNGKKGIYNKKKLVIPHEYEDIEYNALNDRLALQKASKQGVTKFDGTTVVPFNYNKIFFAGRYINAQGLDGSVDIFDADGNKDESAQYASKQNFNNDKYEVVSTLNDEYKIIVNATGQVVEDGYSFIHYLFDKYFIAQKDGLFGVIDDDGNIVIEFKYEEIQPTTEFNIIQLRSEGGKISLLNKNFEEIAKGDSSNIVFMEGYLKFVNKESTTYINKNGEIAENTEVYSGNKLFSYIEKNKFGFKDKGGNVVVESKYNKVTEFNEYGVAGIKQGDLWGVINQEGEVIQEPVYNLLDEPEFIGKYYKVDFGYGEPYYTE